MRREYFDIMKYKTRHKAKLAAPWAVKIAKCHMGWMALESLDDYKKFKMEIGR